MNIFDIIGPVMVGPSSSHTAGLVRIGNIVNKILGTVPVKIDIKFHGSFAKTYKGHGSDKAIIAGLLGFKPDDERIKDIFAIADERCISYSFTTVELQNAHPNTVVIAAATEDGTEINVTAESIGGGNIIIRKIDDIEAEFDGQYDTLVIRHNDEPGVIAQVTSILAAAQVNIATMEVYRSSRGGDAIMIIGADGQLNKNLCKAMELLPHIKRSTIIWGIKH